MAADMSLKSARARDRRVRDRFVLATVLITGGMNGMDVSQKSTSARDRKVRVM